MAVELEKLHTRLLRLCQPQALPSCHVQAFTSGLSFALSLKAMNFSAILGWKVDLEKPEIWREYTMYHNLGEHRPVKLPGLAVGVLLVEATLCCGWIKCLFSP